MMSRSASRSADREPVEGACDLISPQTARSQTMDRAFRGLLAVPDPWQWSVVLGTWTMRIHSPEAVT